MIKSYNYKLAYVILVLLAAAFNLQAADLTDEQERQIRVEIKQLVDTYAIARDNLDANAYADTFTLNATLKVRGESFTGRRDLRARINNLPKNFLSMHIMSSSHVDIIDSDNATGIHYATVYTGSAEDVNAPIKTDNISNFAVMGKYIDRYERTDEGWKIAEREMQPVFFPEN